MVTDAQTEARFFTVVSLCTFVLFGGPLTALVFFASDAGDAHGGQLSVEEGLFSFALGIPLLLFVGFFSIAQYLLKLEQAKIPQYPYGVRRTTQQETAQKQYEKHLAQARPPAKIPVVQEALPAKVTPSGQAQQGSSPVQHTQAPDDIVSSPKTSKTPPRSVSEVQALLYMPRSRSRVLHRSAHVPHASSMTNMTHSSSIVPSANAGPSGSLDAQLEALDEEELSVSTGTLLMTERRYFKPKATELVDREAELQQRHNLHVLIVTVVSCIVGLFVGLVPCLARQHTGHDGAVDLRGDGSSSCGGSSSASQFVVAWNALSATAILSIIPLFFLSSFADVPKFLLWAKYAHVRAKQVVQRAAEQRAGSELGSSITARPNGVDGDDEHKLHSAPGETLLLDDDLDVTYTTRTLSSSNVATASATGMSREQLEQLRSRSILSDVQRFHHELGEISELIRRTSVPHGPMVAFLVLWAFSQTVVSFTAMIVQTPSRFVIQYGLLTLHLDVCTLLFLWSTVRVEQRFKNAIRELERAVSSPLNPLCATPEVTCAVLGVLAYWLQRDKGVVLTLGQDGLIRRTHGLQVSLHLGTSKFFHLLQLGATHLLAFVITAWVLPSM